MPPPPATPPLLEQARAGLAGLPVEEPARARALAALAPWLAEERFAACRGQLESLIRRGRFELLFDCFWQTIPFGTGGRRGAVGLGTNRFNPWTLGTSVQGHAEILRETYPGEEVSVVIAWDVRVFRDVRGVYDASLPNPLLGLRSADFAMQAAGVYAANGVRVSMLDPRKPNYMSTPELSLAIRRLAAHGGLNVSASHNHPDDNGGKFYNRAGGQDVPPDDEILARRVEGIGAVRTLEWETALREGWIRLLGESENKHYLDVNRRLALAPGQRGGVIVYTPLNGTGSCTVGRLLAAEGFDVREVPSQSAFDGGFPQVKFLAPNPEVPSCFEEAEQVADAAGADLILATDPDADRIGLEVAAPGGGWRFVTGNEILYLIARFVLDKRRELGRLPPDAFVLTTQVTSSLVTTIARSYGCAVISRLLVGFKYMADVLAQLERTGAWEELRARPESFVLGAEESHGVLLTPAIRDKDAAGGALALAELNAVCRARGRTLHDELDAIYKRFGYVSCRLVNTVMSGSAGLARIRAIQQSLREDPPASVAGRAVSQFEDLADERCWLGPIKSGTDAAARNVLVFGLADGSRVVIRPSGTEPKNKIYIEVPGTTPDRDLTDAELAAERSRCDAAAAELGRAFERLMLARVGLEVPDHALAVSGLVGLDHKLHFANVFLPELARRASAGGDRAGMAAAGLATWIDRSLSPYGRDPRDLVAAGVAAWIATAGLSPTAERVVREAFRIPR
ncbi:MAG TPA: phospho-sugar mutase [Planctomycetota bacterium]|nr:phospho-sugar mutase [Planctomycetota bacterium]